MATVDVALPGLKLGYVGNVYWMQMVSNRRVDMGVWLVVASDVGMTQQVPQIRNYWLLERQCIQMAYVERMSLSHHDIFSTVKTKRKSAQKCSATVSLKCILPSLFLSLS